MNTHLECPSCRQSDGVVNVQAAYDNEASRISKDDYVLTMTHIGVAPTMMPRESAVPALSRKLNPREEELVRAIRFMVAAEYEAIQLYMQLAESTDSKLALEVLKDIADKERVHAGEFLRLLRELAPDEEEFYAEGAAEVEAKIEKVT